MNARAYALTAKAHAALAAVCRWCGDPDVVFTNRAGGHCAACYADGREAQELHEAGA